MKTKLIGALAALSAVCALAHLAGCGGDDSSSPSGNADGGGGQMQQGTDAGGDAAVVAKDSGTSTGKDAGTSTDGSIADNDAAPGTDGGGGGGLCEAGSCFVANDGTTYTLDMPSCGIVGAMYEIDSFGKNAANDTDELSMFIQAIPKNASYPMGSFPSATQLNVSFTASFADAAAPSYNSTAGTVFMTYKTDGGLAGASFTNGTFNDKNFNSVTGSGRVTCP